MTAKYLESAELSDVGRKRKNNEDSCVRLPEMGVYCVADGMGGAMSGDLASEAITTTVQEVFKKATQDEAADFLRTIGLFRKAANQASHWIRSYAEEKVIGQMGSTVVALVFDPRNPTRAVGLHAGDSRVYRFRAGQLKLLTADHSAVAALAAKLGRDPESIPAKYQNELVRAVGLKPSVELERTDVEVESGDLFLICSDGLSRMLPDAEISTILKKRKTDPLDAVARALVDGANEAGGKDNVTVILVKVGDISAFPREPFPEEEDEGKTVAAPETSDSMTPATGGTSTPGAETPATIHGDTPQTDDSTSDKTSAPDRTMGMSESLKAKGSSPKGFIFVAAIAVVVTAAVWIHQMTRSAQRPPAAPPATAGAPSQKAGAGGPAAPPPPPSGHVVIETEPAGAEIYKMGGRIGVTPFEANVPAGAVTYQFSTMTHTGQMALNVIAGKSVATNVVLEPRYGKLAVSSDPPGAHVLEDSQELGRTPSTISLTAGRHALVLKYAGLRDSAVSPVIAADQVFSTNVAFAYGSVEIQSEPPGATVTAADGVSARTPYQVNIVAPGLATYQLALDGYDLTNVTLQVADHQSSRISVPLRQGHGILKLAGNHSGIKALVDGAEVTMPGEISVDAGVPHTVAAEYQGRWQTNQDVRVGMNETRLMSFTFAAAVSAGPMRVWTNEFGMVFVKPAGRDFWIGTTRVSPEQYERIVQKQLTSEWKGQDDGAACVINASIRDIKSFVEKLSAGLKQGGGLPAGYEAYAYAVPTPEQWKYAADSADALGLRLRNNRQFSEWCMGPDNVFYFAGYVPGQRVFTPRKIVPQPAPDEALGWISIRLALVKQ